MVVFGIGSMVLVGLGWTLFGYVMGKAPRQNIKIPYLLICSSLLALAVSGTIGLYQGFPKVSAFGYFITFGVLVICGIVNYFQLDFMSRAMHHITVHELYGSPESMRRFDLLYGFLTSMGFNKKTVIAGYSRGGLDTYMWAAKNTDKVSCLYLDNPVCDFKSWPGGKGIGPGDKQGWKNCLKAWNFTEKQAMEFKGNPIDNLKPLADARIPILHLCGDADEVVPPTENTVIIEKRYKKLGGHIEVFWKRGAKHHPHCLKNPQPIVDFILKYNSK